MVENALKQGFQIISSKMDTSVEGVNNFPDLRVMVYYLKLLSL